MDSPDDPKCPLFQWPQVQQDPVDSICDDGDEESADGIEEIMVRCGL